MTEPKTDANQKLHAIAPYLIVNDLAKSAEFYRDKLASSFIETAFTSCSKALVYRAAVWTGDKAGVHTAVSE